MVHLPAPLPVDEPTRLQALQQCCVLGTESEEAFDQIVHIAAEVARTPIALVSLVDEARQWFKAKVGLDVCETPRDVAFCAHAILAPDPLIIENALNDERTAENPLVLGAPHIRFYAGFPLELSSGERLGTLCVIDMEPRTLDERALGLLASLARQTASQLELRRSVFRLEEANRERDDLIERLRQAREDVARASRAKSDFLANMSHEIRTPMTAILGYTDLLIDEGIGVTDATGHLETMRRNGLLLLAIINDILDLSKIEAGEMDVECIEVEPRAVLEDVRALMQGTADQKGIELAIDVDEDIPARLCSDPVRLHQVVLNLVSNAVKFTDAGQVRISVRRRPSSTSPCAIAIDVEDSGIGIDPKKIETIFEPFRQADATTTRSHGGTGLGLCLSRKLAEKLGGRISVESTPGRGSRFTFHLDAKVTGRDSTPAAGPAARQPETAPTADGAAAPLDGVRVLLAEDGPDNRHLITYFLKRAGAEVVHAENGREAIEAIDRAAAAGDRIDVVLMDMQMPEMDGYTAAGILRSRGNRIPVIALTAHAMSSDRDRCIEAGCDDYLPKPIDRPTLIERVSRAGRRSGTIAPGVG